MTGRGWPRIIQIFVCWPLDAYWNNNVCCQIMYMLNYKSYFVIWEIISWRRWPSFKAHISSIKLNQILCCNYSNFTYHFKNVNALKWFCRFYVLPGASGVNNVPSKCIGLNVLEANKNPLGLCQLISLTTNDPFCRSVNNWHSNTPQVIVV